jgi:hypothetical protein
MSSATTRGTGWICAANLEVKSVSKIDQAGLIVTDEKNPCGNFWRALLGPGKSKGE